MRGKTAKMHNHNFVTNLQVAKNIHCQKVSEGDLKVNRYSSWWPWWIIQNKTSVAVQRTINCDDDCFGEVDADGHVDGDNGNLLPRPLFHRSLEAREQPVQLRVEQPNLIIYDAADYWGYVKSCKKYLAKRYTILGTPGANKDSCVWLFSLCLPPILCFSPPIFNNVSLRILLI